MNRLRLQESVTLLALLIAIALAGTANADTAPTLNDILNASHLGVRSSAVVPRPADARIVEITADAPLTQAFHVGPNITRLAKIAVWFTGWSTSWTQEKSLVLRLYPYQDPTHLLGEAEEPYSRRLWEGGVHVFTLNVPVSPDSDYAFQLSVRGGRSLAGAALAAAPLDPNVGPLMIGRAPADGALWFETYVKRRSDLDLIYLDLFSHFDLSRADMRPVREAVTVHDWDRARRALVAHFEGRRDLFPPGSGTSSRLQTPGTALADADLVVDHRHRAVDEIVDLGPRWNHQATWRSRGGIGLTRSGLRGILAAAYAGTHDEKYARAWDAMLRYQFEDLPSPLRAGVIPPGAQEISPAGEPGIGGGSMWSSLSIAARLMHGFAYYRAFKNSPSFTEEARFAFIANLAEMSDVLEKMKGGGNWDAQNTTAMLDFATTFPEFVTAPVWIARGFNGAMRSCLENTFPDGPLREASSNYHMLSLNRYLGVLETDRRRPAPGLHVPEEARDRIEKMCDFLLYSTLPDRDMPCWGDSNPPLDPAALLLRGADLFGRSDLRWAATRGKSGTAPKAMSMAFPEAGYYIMRSGWSSDSTCIEVHNGASSAHGHSDANSLVLSAFGSALLIDPGVAIYGTADARLLSQTVAHNTVTMDDLNTLNDRGFSDWTSGRWTDLYSGANAGYEEQSQADSGARHRRIALFVKPDIAFIVDTAAGEMPHDWSLRYHFAPGTLETSHDGRLTTFRRTPSAAYPGRPKTGLRLWGAVDDGLHLTATVGPVSGGWEHTVEAPAVSWSRFQARSATWATLLQPFAAEAAPRPWEVRQDDNGTAMAFERQGRDRRFILVRTKAESPLPDAWLEQTGITTDADAAVYFEVAAGANAGITRRLTLQGGTLLLDRNADIPAVARCEQAPALLEAEWKGDLLTVHRVGGSGITLRTFGASRLMLDGRRLDISPGRPLFRLPDTNTPAEAAIGRPPGG